MRKVGTIRQAGVSRSRHETEESIAAVAGCTGIVLYGSRPRVEDTRSSQLIELGKVEALRRHR